MTILERQECFEQLCKALADIEGLGGRIALIHGEAGIGKSTVVRQFLNTLPRGTQQAVGYCDPLNTPRPLGPIREVVPRPGGEAAEESTYFDGFVNDMAEAADVRVLVLEDLHWSDQRTLDWLKFVGRRISQLPLLLIVTYRDDDPDGRSALRAAVGAMPTRHVIRLPLVPLSFEAVEHMFGGDAERAEQVYAVTQGNPFFVSEMAGWSSAADHVPASVADAVIARLLALPAEAQGFLQFASCNPGELPLDVLPATGFDAFEGLIDLGVQSRFLAPSGSGVAFRHELTRLAIFAEITPAHRIAHHQRWLDAYLAHGKDSAQYDRLLHHAERALRPDLVRRFAPQAARQAAQLGAHLEAAQFLRAAVECLGDADDEPAAEILEAYAYEAGLSVAIDDEVIAARQRAISIRRALEQPVKVAENLRLLSRAHWYRGEAELAERYIHDSIHILEADKAASPEDLAQAFALRAVFHMLRDRMAEAIEWGQKALARASSPAVAEVRAHALNTVGTAMLFRGDEAGEALLRESLEISHVGRFHEQAARVYTNLSECLIEAGAFAKAEALLEEGIAFDTAHDLDAWTYYLVGRKAQLVFELDRFAEAVMITDECLRQENQTLLMQMPALTVRARARLRQGAPDADTSLAEALQAAEQITEPQYLAPIHTAMLEAAVLAGTPDAARASSDWLKAQPVDGLSPRKAGEFLMWEVLSGRDAPQTGDLPEAFSAFAAGDYTMAAAAFADARTRYLAAWCHVAEGSPDALARAHRIFADLGSARAADLVARRSGQRSQTPDARGPYHAARHHPYGLTAKEQSVLRHLVDGKSNASIAETLSRSRRTVENHVSSILSKLHCANRLDAVLKVHAEPWIARDDTEARP